MTPASDWNPPGVDVNTPSAARIYDYLLGGASNFAADRELGDKIVTAFPLARDIARANRAFVVRAVRGLARQGFNQFVDIGCGLPTVGAVHDVVHAQNQACRVVYVDNELVAVIHARQALRGVTHAGVVEGDVRDLKSIVTAPGTRALIDWGRPVVVVLTAVLHFIPDTEHPAAIMAGLRAVLAPGSVVLFSHGTAGPDLQPTADVVQLYRQSQNVAVPRTRSEIAGLLAGYELEPPGLTWVTEWYPDPTVRNVATGPNSHMLGAVARVPG